jgi:hypothetical protein
MHQLDIGGVIQRGINVWTKNALPFTLIAAVVMLPSFFINAGSQMAQLSGGEKLTIQLIALVAGLFSAIFQVIAQAVLSGMICYSVFRTLKGAAPSLQESLSMAMRSLLPIFLLSLLQGFAIFCGTLACIIPGIILSVMFYVAMPALVVEGLGPVDALKRSMFLTEGNKVYIFVLLIVVGVASGVVGALVGGCFTTATVGAAVASGSKAALMVATVINQIPVWIISAIGATLGATLSTTVYHDLRQMRDGVNVDDLLSVFD